MGEPAGGTSPPGGEEAALRALEARLARATAAAERLLAEAEAEAEGEAEGAATTRGGGDRGVANGGEPSGDGVPSSGWQRPGGDGPGAGRPWEPWVETEDAELLLAVIAAARELIPPELRQRLAAAVRELLLALRALVDWCLARAERRRAAPLDVQDIPIL